MTLSIRTRRSSLAILNTVKIRRLPPCLRISVKTHVSRMAVLGRGIANNYFKQLVYQIVSRMAVLGRENRDISSNFCVEDGGSGKGNCKLYTSSNRDELMK
jgi:hypothetical protein